MRRIGALLLLLPLSMGAALATVNVNTAQQSELQRIPGLDKYKAKAIIEYRAQNGAFTSIEDLRKVAGLDRDTVEALKTQLALTGDPYVAPKVQAQPKKK